MENQRFLGATVLTKNGQTGVVSAIQEGKATVAFEGVTKTYDIKMAFERGFLRFTDETINHNLEEEMAAAKKKDGEEESRQAAERAAYVEKYKQANEEFKDLRHKAAVMKKLFGDDFVYPPFVEHVRKYRNCLDEFLCEPSLYHRLFPELFRG